ncbi:MAG: MbnP family protein, partial [Chitinophagales bacterium]
MHKKIFRALIVLSCALIFLGSCDKKKGCTDSAATNFDSEAEVDCCCEYDTIPADSLATFSMNLTQFVGSEVFIPGNTYSIGGVKTQLEIARFYISNVRLINASGNEVPFEGLYLLADPGFDNYDLGNAPAGEYTKILFDVGLDEETNHSDPGDYPS